MSGTSNGIINSEDPPPYYHCTTSSILLHAAEIFFSLLPKIIFIALLLFSFRILVESGTVYITTVIDRDPALKSLLSRIDLSATPAAAAKTPHHQQQNQHSSSFLSPPPRRNRHRPFLHLTRVGTLDDDFFSSDDDNERSLFGSHVPATNSTLLPLSLLTAAAIRPGVTFRFARNYGTSFNSSNSSISTTNDSGDGDVAYDLDHENNDGDNDVVDLRFFMAGLELRRQDAAALLFLVSVLSAAYGWVILGFVITYSWALGIVFTAVVNDLLGKYSSFCRTVWSGSNLGIKRLSGFILMRWAVRDALTQVLGLWFFGEIRDQYSFFKLFLRLKLMPFSVPSPWVPGYDKEVSGFLFSWFLVDTIVSFVFAVDCWVTIVNTRRGGREIVKEGCYLLAAMIHQSIQLKCLELIFCGAFLRWVLARVFGRSVAVVLQSLVEVYFMVAWLIFYFAARCKDASLSGRRFGMRELEALIEGLR